MIDKIRAAKQEFKQGKIRRLPCLISNLAEFWKGPTKGKFGCITAPSNVGKSPLARKICVFDPIEQFIKYGINGKIVFFGLEETEEEFDLNLYSYLCFKLLKFRFSEEDFLSYDTEFPEEVINTLENSDLDQTFQLWKSYITYYEDIYNPTGIHKEVRDNIATERGVFYSKATDKPCKPSDGRYYYVPNDPKEFVIVVIDHVNDLLLEKGMTSKKDAIQKMNEYCKKTFCKALNYYVCNVQQQDMTLGNLEHIKAKSIEPSFATLGNDKEAARIYQEMIALYDPTDYNMTHYPSAKNGYDLNRLYRYSRFISIIKARKGQKGKRIPLFFDGKVGHFGSLPHWSDPKNLEKYYNKASQLSKQ